MESAADLPQPIPELSFPLAAEECLPQQGTVSAPPQLETAVPAPLLKVACSLCKTIQDAGQLYCIHCGAMFINDMTA